MHRFIAHLLIISVLTVNAAWAMDDCALQYSNAAGLVLSSDLSADKSGKGICDDLCVGWLHLVAIASDTQLDYFPSTHQAVVGISFSFRSLDPAPPIRPPQI